MGELDPCRAGAALASIALPAFSLDLDGVGTFTSPAGAVTLWAGGRTSPDLLRIHAAVAEVLAPLGFRPESRPYTPHITLGRYEAGASEEAVNAFLARSCPRGLGLIESFSLFSSAFVDGAPVYRRERAYRLAPVIRDS